MLAIIGGLFFIFGLYLLYVAVSFLKIPTSEYKTYKSGLSSIINTIIGKNKIEREGVVNGDSRDQITGALNTKSSYSPEHTKRLFES